MNMKEILNNNKSQTIKIHCHPNSKLTRPPVIPLGNRTSSTSLKGKMNLQSNRILEKKTKSFNKILQKPTNCPPLIPLYLPMQAKIIIYSIHPKIIYLPQMKTRIYLQMTIQLYSLQKIKK